MVYDALGSPYPRRCNSAIERYPARCTFCSNAQVSACTAVDSRSVHRHFRLPRPETLSCRLETVALKEEGIQVGRHDTQFAIIGKRLETLDQTCQLRSTTPERTVKAKPLLYSDRPIL